MNPLNKKEAFSKVGGAAQEALHSIKNVMAYRHVLAGFSVTLGSETYNLYELLTRVEGNLLALNGAIDKAQAEDR